jgi:hypothetical protein
MILVKTNHPYLRVRCHNNETWSEKINSPAELPKCVCTQNKQELKAHVQNKKNRTLRFGKPDYSVLSILTAVRDATVTR